MEKVVHNFTITHTFADGRVMSDDEFMAHPVVVNAELNQDVFESIKIILAPEHIKRQRQLEKFKKSQQLKEKLLVELANIGGGEDV